MGALWLACAGPNTLSVHMANAEHHANDADATLDEAEAHLNQLEPDAAADKLRSARASLSDPDIGYYPEHEMLQQRLARDEARLPAVRKEREKRDLAAAVASQSERLEKVLPAFDRALSTLGQKVPTRPGLDESRDAVAQLERALKDGRALESRDGPYGARARQLTARLEKAQGEVALYQKRLDFAEGPGGLYEDAARLVKEAHGVREAPRRADLYTDALDKLQRCSKDVEERLTATPALAHSGVTVDGKSTTPAALAAQWRAQLAQVKKQLALAQAQVAREKQREQRKRKAPPKRTRG